MSDPLFVLRPAAHGNLNEVRRLVREAAEWLRKHKNTDQWAKPWPDLDKRDERILNDLLKGKTWLLWEGAAAAGTITIDREEPVDARDNPVWPEDKRLEPAVYVRRIVVSRRPGHFRRGLGAALLDWAANVALHDYDAPLIRVDVWTTNQQLHAYYERQRFTRCAGRDPGELADYPSQALFERHVSLARSEYSTLFTEEDSPRERRSRHLHIRPRLALIFRAAADLQRAPDRTLLTRTDITNRAIATRVHRRPARPRCASLAATGHRQGRWATSR